jgi:tetratricopeptide (TPR) repeat protein
MVSEYIFSGSLPESATTYVRRDADDQLYYGLKSGKFCYVLNSRQTGKSSLRVRTLRRLADVGFACAPIDLSFDEVQEVTPEQWYVGLIDTLIDSFGLELDLETWWYERHLLSPLKRFRKFLEEVLLLEVTEPIVIFIDEIDSVLSLKFPTDDFFAFIRACHNQRADNPQYNRLTFCLLGVASPSNLIEDKKRTPFNIGQAITLSGFRFHEVEPLLKGLSGRFGNPEAVMREILAWTGGQPFLTQKLCQLMVTEGEHPRSVERVVREQIIDSWEVQDEPEHLRTIRDRIITRDEQKAGYLLELYQQIWRHGEIDSKNTSEQSELQLSGLVVRREGKLGIYNPIYQAVFNRDWIEQQLAMLRPYSEAFRAWVASGNKDESRLLRGKALQDARAWGKERDLSYLDRQFLAASKEKEIEEQIAAQKKEAELERERKDREAVEKRNRVLAEANRKARRRIQIGAAVLILAVVGAVTSVVFAGSRVVEANREVDEAKDELAQARRETEGEQQKAQQAQANLTLASREIEGLEQKAQNLEQQRQKQSRALDQAKRELVSLGRMREQAQRAAKDAQANANEAAQREARAKKETQQARAEASQQEARAKEAQEQLESLEVAYNEKQTEIETITEEVDNIREAQENLSQLAALGGRLYRDGKSEEASEIRAGVGLAYQIQDNLQDRTLTQALLFAYISQAHQYLEEWDEAERAIARSLNLLPSQENIAPLSEQGAIWLYALNNKGSLLKQEGKTEKAIETYAKAFDTLQSAWSQLPKVPINTEIPIPSFLPEKQPILSASTVENLHREYIELLSESGEDAQTVKDSLLNHFLAELNYWMRVDNWRDADITTYEVMLYVAGIEEERYLDIPDIENFSCPTLRTMDTLWVKYSEGKFGFSVQKRILDEILAASEQPNRSYTDLTNQEWEKFGEEVGWAEGSSWSIKTFNPKKAQKGHLPKWIRSAPWLEYDPATGHQTGGRRGDGEFFSITATCGL